MRSIRRCVICGERIPITLESRDGPAAMGDSWRASEPPRRDSEQLYLSLWGRLRILKPADRENVLGQLRMIFNSGAPDPRDFPMSKDDVRTLRDGGTFSVGAHTVSHPMLSSLRSGRARAGNPAEPDGLRGTCGHSDRGVRLPLR